MKICHFIASSKFGGAERVVSNLCNEMSKEHEVHFITFDCRENLKETSSRVHLHTIKEFKRYNIFALLKLVKLINDINPDIMHTHGAKATRIVYNIRFLMKSQHIGTKHNARKGRIFNKIQHVVAVSNDAAKSVTSNDVKVIYNGIEPIEVSPQKKDKTFTLLSIGRLDKIKGFDILIEECAKLNFPFRLHIIGEGTEKENLETLIEKLHLTDKVNLLGFKKDIPQLMHNADIIVMSSHSEGFSLVMIEALFYANLFVSTKVSGATEILDNRFLFDGFSISQKLNDIYKNYTTYIEEYSVLTKGIKEKFFLTNIVHEHIIYYQAILNSKKSGSN